MSKVIETPKEVKIPKTVINAEGKRVKRPVQESNRKRPSKAFIEMTADIRGFMTGNEKLQLKTLALKNAWQRINNRAMSDNVNDNFDSQDVKELSKLINNFVKNIDIILK